MITDYHEYEVGGELEFMDIYTMNKHHFNNDNFMTHFNMDRKEYHLVDEVALKEKIIIKIKIFTREELN